MSVIDAAGVPTQELAWLGHDPDGEGAGWLKRHAERTLLSESSILLVLFFALHWRLAATL